MSLEERKEKLRDELERRRRGLDAATVARAAAEAVKRLEAIEALRSAATVAGYWPIDGELDLRDFLRRIREEGKNVCLPRRRPGNATLEYELAEPERNAESLDGALGKGGFGVMEPVGGRIVDAADVDAWLVPGVGFDRAGNRLGRGGGVYDSLLDGAPGLKIGVGYGCQLVDEIPAGERDRKMDAIVTEKETIWIG